MTDEKTTNSFANLLQNFLATLPKTGELVKGKVTSLDNGEVRLDIGGVMTGVVRGPELFAESEEFSRIKVGDEVEATVIDQENENGEIELSFREAGHKIVWNKMKKYVSEGITVEAKIIHANKGGLMMQVDALVGFMPVSQLSPENYPRVQGGDKNKILEYLKQMIGKTLQVKVLDAEEKDEKLILSEKEVWEDEQKAVLDSYNVGDIVEGEVSALTSFGAFVKFGEGLEGLVHISEIVWQRIDHPKDVLKVGDNVKAQIIDINKSKIYLSVKRLIEDPWKNVKDNYKVGEKIKGEIHKIESFGHMVKLDEDIHGLAHISELEAKDLNDLRERFKIGQKHEFEIISIEPSEHRLGLKFLDDNSKTSKKEEKKEEVEEKKTEEKEKEVKEVKKEEKAEDSKEDVDEKVKTEDATEDATEDVKK